MTNVINLLTGQPIELKTDSLYDDRFSEQINALAQRHDTDCESVYLKPRIKVNSQDQLVIKTYSGNVHTNKIPYHNNAVGNKMPLPVQFELYTLYIANNNIKHILLDDECFMYMDRKYKITVNLLKDLADLRCLESITIRTRSDLFAHDQYLDLIQALESQGVNIEFKLYGMSISESQNKARWPGSPSVKRRQMALNKALETLKTYKKHLRSL